MKKTFIIVTALVITVVIGTFVSKATTDDFDSELILPSVEALARKETPSNFGPAAVYDCQYGGSKKICLCETGNPPCTESDCF